MTDWSELNEELVRQGWTVERTNASTHFRALPPAGPGMVHYSFSGDHRAIKNTLSELRKHGFIWPPPPKSSLRGSRLASADYLRCPNCGSQSFDTSRGECIGVCVEPAAPASSALPTPEPAPAPERPVSTLRPRTFGAALQHWRTVHEISQEALAELVGVTGQAVHYWEHDINSPIRDHYEKLLSLLPELQDAPEPDTRDIDKPPGRYPSEGADTELDFDVIASPSTEEPPVQQQAPPPPAPAPPPLPAPEPTNDVLVWTELVLRLRASADLDDFRSLLVLAARFRLSIDQLLKLLR